MGTTIIKAILCSIFLIFFNLLFFILCGTENNSSTWISYGFIHVAYLLLLITPLFNKENKGKAILSMTLFTISLFYFFIELMVGILECKMDLDSPSYYFGIISFSIFK